MVRIGIALAAILPPGFLLGFAFPTGMRLVEAIDRQPTPWFWGTNGATGVLASVLAVMFPPDPTSFVLLGLGGRRGDHDQARLLSAAGTR
jgi:hypothetical protein